MIVQTENGRYRLKQEFDSVGDGEAIEEFIRVSEPPPFGLTLSHAEFRVDIQAALDAFKPDVVILDPWNAAAKDDRQKDYAETFDALRSLLPTGKDKPALGIVAHTRKPQPNEKRTGGTGLMHMLAGSYLLTSVPRSIFVMARGSEDETDDTVIWFNPKNSNGPNAPRSAWRRLNGSFAPAEDFDWKEFDKPADKRATVRIEHLTEVFKNGEREMELNDAVLALETAASISKSAAYNALKPEGRFAKNLRREGKKVRFIP